MASQFFTDALQRLIDSATPIHSNQNVEALVDPNDPTLVHFTIGAPQMVDSEERYFEATGSAGGKKFWTVARSGNTIHVHFGKVGTKGSHRDMPCSNSYVAQSELEQMVKAKLNRGYVEGVPAAKVAKIAASISNESSFASPLATSKQPRFSSLNLDSDDEEDDP